MLREPCLILSFRDNAQVGLHAGMPGTTDLRAQNRIIARYGGRKVDMHLHARDGILLDAHAGNKKPVNHIKRADAEVYLAPCWKNEDTGDDVVLAARIRRIKAKRISGWRVDELGPRGAEHCVRAGVTEIPLELYACDLYLQGLR